MKVPVHCSVKKMQIKSQKSFNTILYLLCSFVKELDFFKKKKERCFVTAKKLKPWHHWHSNGLQIILSMKQVDKLTWGSLSARGTGSNVFNSGGDCPITIATSHLSHLSLCKLESCIKLCPAQPMFFSRNLSMGTLLQTRRKGTEICCSLSTIQANHYKTLEHRCSSASHCTSALKCVSSPRTECYKLFLNLQLRTSVV